MSSVSQTHTDGPCEMSKYARVTPRTAIHTWQNFILKNTFLVFKKWPLEGEPEMLFILLHIRPHTVYDCPALKG